MMPREHGAMMTVDELIYFMEITIFYPFFK